MDRCDACVFVYDDVAVTDLPTELRAAARLLAERLQPDGFQRNGLEPDGLVPDDQALRTRPEPDVWSALEYACHVRDMLDVQRARVALALVEDSPIFTPMGRDERVERDGYNQQDPTVVAAEVVVAADRLADALEALDPVEWQRTGIYTWPTTESRSLAWVGRHTLHELRHHTADIDRVLVSPS